jgi:HEAT repeat protein
MMRAGAPLVLAAVFASLALAGGADDPETVRAAAASPGSIEERAARVRALGGDAILALASEPALATAAAELLAPVLAGEPDDDLRRMALAWLASRPRFERALPRLPRPLAAGLAEPLLRYLASGEEEEAPDRTRALLDEILDRRGLGPVLSLADDPAVDGPLAAELALALGRARRQDAIPPLLSLGARADPPLAVAVAGALGEIPDGSGRQVPFLVSLLAGKDLTVRKAAAVALGRLRASGGVDGLIAALAEADEGLRGEAQWALREITGRALPPEPARWRALWDEERRRAEADLPVVLLELDSGKPTVVIDAMREAAGFVAGRERARAALVGLLASPTPGLRAAACAALGELRDPSVVARLAAALDDPDASVWEAAWRALERITGKTLPPRRAVWERLGVR